MDIGTTVQILVCSKVCINLFLVSLVAQMLKNLLLMQETWVWFLGQKDPLGKGMATHSGIPAWRISWTEEPGGLQSLGLQRVWKIEWLTLSFSPRVCIILFVYFLWQIISNLHNVAKKEKKKYKEQLCIGRFTCYHFIPFQSPHWPVRLPSHK